MIVRIATLEGCRRSWPALRSALLTLVVAALVFSCIAPAVASTFSTISGTVTDSQSGKPLANVAVEAVAP
ncbi:MAG: hypothetical protein ACREP1_06405, partial [Rhodanobacteraceae bacterium]